MNDIHDDAGITLVEIMVSIVVLGVVLTAFAGVMARNLQSLSDSRARQEASFSASEVLETLRDLPVTSAVMATSYDPTLVSCDDGSGPTDGEVDVFGDGSLCEPLEIATPTGDPVADAAADNGRIDDAAPWTGTSDAVTYATYATTVSGTDAVRVTVVVDYELTDGPKEIRRNTIVSEVNRG